MAHNCESYNSWTFDRTLCPEPCGWMHTYCDGCDAKAETCAHDDA